MDDVQTDLPERRTRWSQRLVMFALVLVVGIGGVVILRELVETNVAQVAEVPPGDVEIAWFHTSTNAANWERFVAGIVQARRQHPEMEVDDSRAFLRQTASIPEVVIRWKDKPGKIYIRWYKLSSESTLQYWISALAKRSPPPVAVVGGGSSDRAVELADALREQTTWQGEAPLLLITLATADKVYDAAFGDRNLIEIYPDRTFRFCFTNSAVAKAVVDFVQQSSFLRPQGPVVCSALTAFSSISPTGWAGLGGMPIYSIEPPPKASIFEWEDDPYSSDLSNQFKQQLADYAECTNESSPYSVGSTSKDNDKETGIIYSIVSNANFSPGERMMLVMPGASMPVQRALRKFRSFAPLFGKSSVVLTGDGISFNTLLRDGDYAWPVREMPLPLVSFCHYNPVAWDQTDPPNGIPRLSSPVSTDDVLLYADLIGTTAKELFVADQFPDANVLKNRLQSLNPPMFTSAGDRISGRGEYVVVVLPRFTSDNLIRPETTIQIYKHTDGWQKVDERIRPN
ncbi:MAG: hypothetical protein R3B84_11550 [Zavarzinella sp.]